MFIHCHSVHDYPALPPEAAYKWPLKRGGQGVGRAEWPGCWLRHSLTALSRSLSRPFIWAVGEGKRAKAGGTRGERDFPLGRKKKGETAGKPRECVKVIVFCVLGKSHAHKNLTAVNFFLFSKAPKHTSPANNMFSPMFTGRHKSMCWRLCAKIEALLDLPCSEGGGKNKVATWPWVFSLTWERLVTGHFVTSQGTPFKKCYCAVGRSKEQVQWVKNNSNYRMKMWPKEAYSHIFWLTPHSRPIISPLCYWSTA